MAWLKISNSTELNQFQTDDIVFIHADGNYSDIALVNGTATRPGYCAMADGRMVGFHKQKLMNSSVAIGG